MKKLWLILLIFSYLTGVVSASVEVHNYTFKNSYYPDEKISGKINLTISDEDWTSELHSGNGEEISLGDFLIANGADYKCSPADCSGDYHPSSVSKDKSFEINLTPVYEGFVLNGTNIALTNLNFSIKSNFGKNSRTPLSIKFFEDGVWKFNTFSDVFSSKFWGCYNTSIPSQGPLIGTSEYCETIPLFKTKTLNIGAYVDSGDNKILNMKIYPKEGGGYLGKCSYNPNLKGECQIDAGEGQIFEEAPYQICVSSDSLTNYHIYEENSGDNCGFVYSLGPESSIKDYAIFAQTAKYADAGLLSSVNIDLVGATSMADDLLKTKYGRDCSNGCVLPLMFSGIPQTLRIYNITLQYTKNGENYREKNIYNLKPIPATVDFSGVLDLGLTKFNISESGTYSLYLGNKTLLKEDVRKLSVPIINSLSPLNPPAGISVNYYVNVDYDVPNVSLIYKWKFGNRSYTTTTNSIVHTFDEIKNYTIGIEVNAGGNLTSKKDFVVTSISPAEAINISLSKKTEALDLVARDINTFPPWYRESLEKIVGIPFYRKELNRLKKAETNAVEDKDFLAIVKDVYSLNTPTEIFANENTYPFLWTKSKDIYPKIIEDVVGDSNYKNLEDYKNPILNWQTQKIKGSFSTKVFSVSKWNGDSVPIFRIYKFSINSTSDGESYFVINRPREEIHFNNLSVAKKVDNATVIILNKNNNKNFEFYYESSDEATFFISPRLSAIILKSEIETTCNFNNICEKGLGENSDTCRSDCKPITHAIVNVILAILFALIIYTVLQIWYTRHYEDYLFSDNRGLYNLLMYIANARARGQTDRIIVATLKKQGWSGERIIYAIKKSRGRRTGMFEIIPISKITASFRNRKAKKKIATATQQQNERNINKSKFQRRL